MEFLGEFFMVYFIDIHQLNLRQFRNLKFLDEISLKKMCFLYFFYKWMHNNIFHLQKNHYHIKQKEIL
jgi:hypothetical protein